MTMPGQIDLQLDGIDNITKHNHAKQKIPIRAVVNKWISDNFIVERKYISHSSPEYDPVNKIWLITLCAKKLNGEIIGSLHIDNNLNIVNHTNCGVITNWINTLLKDKQFFVDEVQTTIIAKEYGFIHGDGIEGAKLLDDMSVDLLLTDPPYGISNPYTCESQIPRRMRKDGSDFIMPKGHFGKWDYGFNPKTWTDVILPKIRGWSVIFCAQAQIGEYSEILKNHKFNAVGTFVWQKTNPVPFNHKFKPINAWEAIVIGKRPGTKFNGKVVHNIITCKSPSPQQRIHPTQKPLMIIEKFIELFSNTGEIIFDPFAGSGTTVIAANRMSRKIISYEKDKGYYKNASKRIVKELENEYSQY